MFRDKVNCTTIAYAKLEGDGCLDQFAGLKLTANQTETYAAAKAAEDLKLSSEEIAASRSAGKDPAAIQTKVHEMLLTRYRAGRRAVRVDHPGGKKSIGRKLMAGELEELRKVGGGARDRRTLNSRLDEESRRNV